MCEIKRVCLLSLGLSYARVDFLLIRYVIYNSISFVNFEILITINDLYRLNIVLHIELYIK